MKNLLKSSKIYPNAGGNTSEKSIALGHLNLRKESKASESFQGQPHIECIAMFNWEMIKTWVGKGAIRAQDGFL